MSKLHRGRPRVCDAAGGIDATALELTPTDINDARKQQRPAEFPRRTKEVN